MTNLAATDCRRATALVVHYGTENRDGVNALLQETAEDERVTEMLLSLLGLFDNVIPQLHTQLGMTCLSDVLLQLANDQTAPPDLNRAARLIAHYGNNNVDAINTVLTEACEANAVSTLIIAVLNLYSTVAPAVYTRLGLTALQRSILDFAAREEN